MDQKDIDHIIRKVLVKEADEHEIKLFNQWLNDSKYNQEIFKLLQNAWLEKIPQRIMINEDEVFEKIWVEGAGEGENKNRKTFNWNYIVKIAASFLIIALVGYYFISDLDSSVQKTTEENNKLIVKENPAGQKSKLFLPDGSIVWLNADSKISYPEKFLDSVRMVVLKGEGFFEVAKNDDIPFIVKSDEILTTALGTSFNIEAYPDEPEIKIGLLTGKVKVTQLNNKKEDEVILEPNSGIVFHRDNKTFNDFEFIPENLIAWSNGILIFNKDNFQKVINKLELWYGVKIIIKGNPPKDWRLNGKFKNEYLTNVLETMQFGRDFSYEINNKVLVLNFKN